MHVTTFNIMIIVAAASFGLAVILKIIEDRARREEERQGKFMKFLLMFFAAVMFLVLAIDSGNLQEFDSAWAYEPQDPEPDWPDHKCEQCTYFADPAQIWLLGAGSVISFFTFIAWILQEVFMGAERF